MRAARGRSSRPIRGYRPVVGARQDGAHRSAAGPRARSQSASDEGLLPDLTSAITLTAPASRDSSCHRPAILMSRRTRGISSITVVLGVFVIDRSGPCAPASDVRSSLLPLWQDIIEHPFLK